MSWYESPRCRELTICTLYVLSEADLRERDQRTWSWKCVIASLTYSIKSDIISLRPGTEYELTLIIEDESPSIQIFNLTCGMSWEILYLSHALLIDSRKLIFRKTSGAHALMLCRCVRPLNTLVEGRNQIWNPLQDQRCTLNPRLEDENANRSLGCQNGIWDLEDSYQFALKFKMLVT